MLAGPLAIVIGGLSFYLAGGRYVSTDNAYVKMDKLNITTDVSGIIVEILVRDNQNVQEGQVLYRLDDEPYRIAVAAAEAQLGTVRAEIANLQATYRQSLAQIEQTKTDLTFFEANFNRQHELSKRNVASQAAFDQAKRDHDSTTQRLSAAHQQAEAILAQLAGSAEAPIDDHPRVKQVKAQIDKARRDLKRTVVRAPFAGIVTNVSSLQIGAYSQAGQPGFSLVGSDRIWVEASPKETDLSFVRPGNPATITVDTYPHRIWRARVDSINPASGAEFSVLPPQNASGNWVKVVQRIPVRLEVELLPDAPPLRAGMSVEIEIDTGHRRTLGEIWTTIKSWIGF
ncbi:HlyD family secretion protein [Pseudorhodoplanes sp.]|uniref:HlyD family secretion protein n=1 Tax=Pseudorhodoplanes sp. TaxID=1934341 RepID=UPI003D0AFA14